MTVSYTHSSDKLSFFYKGKPYTVTRGHTNYDKLVKAVYDNDESVLDNAEGMLNYQKAINNSLQAVSSSRVEIRDDEVYVDGEPLHTSLTTRIIELLNEGLSITPMVKFLENLLENPSMSAIKEGYDFLVHDGLPITPDGCFLAYKAVRSDYMDKHSGTIRNKVGDKPSIPRRNVDDDRRKECSYGLHVGGLAYSAPGGTFYSRGDHVMVVKVNPKDIVSVPLDYDANKMRVCAYEVVDEYKVALTAPLYDVGDNGLEAVDSDYDDYDDEDEGMDVESIEVGDFISFRYENETRHLQVLETGDDYCYGMLLHPEENAGGTRRFKFEKMSCINLQ